MIHALKIKPEYFKAVANLNKLFEVRKADRPFRVGDYLALNEIDDCGVYTGACILAQISYILDYPAYLQEGYVVLGLTSNGVIINTKRYADTDEEVNKNMTLNEIEQRLEALQAEKDKLIAELERLKAEEQSKEVKPWRAEYSSKYYYVSDGGVIDCHLDDYDECDNILYSRGNYYRTEALAEQDAKELALRGRVRQLRDALCEGYKFVPQERNFYVFFSHIDKCFHTEWDADADYIGTIWFDTQEHAQKACDILNAEMRKESGGNG